VYEIFFCFENLPVVNRAFSGSDTLQLGMFVYQIVGRVAVTLHRVKEPSFLHYLYPISC